ncbi:hypothetical protein CEXT_462931 [Caerostris extrusa]|uniref:LAGLIDADG homing endonuclease n=1 Tax=Caerostris extrusa TaxID=172846 RepID=A0AAV4XK85_CAEEX|nr:hypothetical protein CEXT_462931 [Caerostris extrusa]
MALSQDFSNERGQDRWIGHAGKIYSSSKNGCALQFIKFTLSDDDMHRLCRCLKIIRRNDRIDHACLRERDMRRTFLLLVVGVSVEFEK